MDTIVKDFQPGMDEKGNFQRSDSVTALSTWQAPTVSPHPQTAEIVRQIDFYFHVDNLRQDAHLLGLIKEGNGTVSLNEILGFRKMRKFKQRSLVKEAVKLCSLVEVLGDGKRLRRIKPLEKPMTVIPKISRDRQKTVVPEDKPWLSKGLMKPTGLEEYATIGPIAPAEYEENQQLYDPDNAFTERIETAIRKFVSKRKWHQDTRLIFEKYMIYGGMDTGSNAFTGGVDSRTKEEMTKKEIAEMTTQYAVSERVLDGFLDDGEEGTPTYIVDFEKTAKGFLSSQFPALCNWYDAKQVMNATNVLRTFFNYLHLHDVCPEYKHQLDAARKVCDLAQEELLKLAIVDTRLPGGFNKACSSLFEGNYADQHAATGDWVVEGDDIGWTREDATTVFLAGIFAHGSDAQVNLLEAIIASGGDLTKAIKVINEEEDVGLEVVSIEPATEVAQKVYEDIRLCDTIVKPMGKLRCKRWIVPHANPQDLPDSALQSQNPEDIFDFLLDDEILQHCFIGMKLEACVKELDIGIKFIDYYKAAYVSFFTWLPNERIREWKEPGPPLAWMQKANAGKFAEWNGEAVDEDGINGADAVEDDDEVPD